MVPKSNSTLLLPANWVMLGVAISPSAVVVWVESWAKLTAGAAAVVPAVQVKGLAAPLASGSVARKTGSGRKSCRVTLWVWVSGMSSRRW